MGNLVTKLSRRPRIVVPSALLLIATARITARWNEWLRKSHEGREPIAKPGTKGYYASYARRVQRSQWDGPQGGIEAHEDGTESLVSVRPRSAGALARGFGSTLGFLALVDVLLARKAVDDTARFFILHAAANLIIVLSCYKDAWRGLTAPIENAVGPPPVIPAYMIMAVFMYHLLAFKNIPKEEWFHHIVFGGGMGISGLYYNVGSITSLASFFIMGLPGGIDYALLAAVKQKLLRPAAEKQVNARMNVWIRAPGLTITGSVPRNT